MLDAAINAIKNSRQTITLHIGAHKTASSLLQVALRHHGEALRKRGTSVVHRREIIKSPFFKSLEKVNEGAYAADMLTDEAAAGFKNFLKNKKSNIIFTNEDMFKSLFTFDFFDNIEEGLAFFKKAGRNCKFRVVLYTRSQPDYIESMYMQYMHLGRTKTFGEFLEGYSDVDLSWFNVAKRLENVVGKNNVKIIPYESIKRLGVNCYFQDFLSACEVDRSNEFEVPEDLVDSRGANRSYSEVALKIARLVNPLIGPEDKKTLRYFLQENFSTSTHPKATLLTEKQRVEMMDEYRDDNIKLFNEYASEYSEELAYYK